MAERGRNRSRSHIFPIFDILSRSSQEIFSIKVGSCVKLVQILHVFGPKFFRGGPTPEIFDLDYLIGVDSGHVVKFRGDRPRELGDPMAG